MILKGLAASLGVTEGQLKIGLGILLLLIYSSFIWSLATDRMENKMLKQQKKAVQKAIAEHNKDAEVIREVEILTEEKIKYVDKIVYETVTETITLECDAATELTGVFNTLVEGINSQLPVHTD